MAADLFAPRLLRMTLALLRRPPSAPLFGRRRLLLPTTLPPATRLFPPTRAAFLARAITLLRLAPRPLPRRPPTLLAAIAAPCTTRG